VQPLGRPDEQEFAELFRASWARLYRLALAVSGDPATAEDDLQNATEVVLDERNRLQPQRWPRDRASTAAGGSGGRAAAGLLRIGNTVGAAITNRRVLEPVEARIMIVAALVLLAVGVVVALFPTVLAYPIAAGAMWVGVALLYRSYRLKRAAGRARTIR